MTRAEAIEISNLAGQMLMEVEQYTAKRFGIVYPIRDTDALPSRERMLLESLLRHRTKIAEKTSSLVEKPS